METKPQKKLGRPVSAPDATEYNVRLNPLSAEWAKRQPGGLSAMIRTYLDNQYRIDSELKDLNARLQRSAGKGE